MGCLDLLTSRCRGDDGGSGCVPQAIELLATGCPLDLKPMNLFDDLSAAPVESVDRGTAALFLSVGGLGSKGNPLHLGPGRPTGSLGRDRPPLGFPQPGLCGGDRGVGRPLIPLDPAHLCPCRGDRVGGLLAASANASHRLAEAGEFRLVGGDGDGGFVYDGYEFCGPLLRGSQFAAAGDQTMARTSTTDLEAFGGGEAFPAAGHEERAGGCFGQQWQSVGDSLDNPGVCEQAVIDVGTARPAGGVAEQPVESADHAGAVGGVIGGRLGERQGREKADPAAGGEHASAGLSRGPVGVPADHVVE